MRWTSDNDVERKIRQKRRVYFERLIEFIPCLHNHENINVAVIVRRAISMGAKEDDFFRMKGCCQFPSELSNHKYGHLRTAKPSV